MKSIKILATVVFMLFASITTAQDRETDNRENLKFGVKAGLNYSNVFDSRSDDFHADPKFGFAGGAFLSIPFNKYIGFQPEILISQKGFKGGGRLLGSEYSFKRTSTFIDIPLQISFKPSEFITFLAGPQYSFLIRQKDDFESTNMSFSQEQEFKNDNIRKNIFGIATGVDINLMQIVVSARLGWDVMNNHGDGSSSSPRYKNSWIQGTVGYTFN